MEKQIQLIINAYSSLNELFHARIWVSGVLPGKIPR